MWVMAVGVGLNLEECGDSFPSGDDEGIGDYLVEIVGEFEEFDFFNLFTDI